MANTMRYDTAVMSQVAHELNKLGNELTACKSTVNWIAAAMDQASGSNVQCNHSTRLSLSGMTVGHTSAENCLRQYARALDRYHNIADTLAKNVLRASDLLQDNENELCNMAINTGSASAYGKSGGEGVSLTDLIGQAVQVLAGKPVDHIDFDWKNLLLDVLGEAGSLGAIISSLVNLSNTPVPAELAKYLVKSAFTSVKWAKGLMGWSKLKNFGTGYATKTYLKKLVGLERFIKTPSRAASKWNAFKANFGKSFKSGMTSAASWITAGISSAVSNYNEFGGKITDRCVVEWATETAATVAIGAATTAAVGAGFVAAGIAAPAIAVGAAATVVYVGVDTLWKNTVGNGSTIVESVGHTVGEAYDAAKAGISNAASWIGNKLDGIKSGFNIRALWA